MAGALPARASLRPRRDRCVSAYGPWQPVSWSFVYVVYGLTIIWLEYVGGSFGSENDLMGSALLPMSHTSGVSVVFFGGFLPFSASSAMAVPTPPMAAGLVTAAPGAPAWSCSRNLLLSAPITGTFPWPAFLSATTTT